MVSLGRAALDTDVFVAGGGPAGLAAALAARQAGLRVVLADRGEPPIDKACGEGLMPDGIAALRQLGIHLASDQGHSFRGLRFLDGGLEAEAGFAAGCGIGIRRTVLHRIMAEHAGEMGVELRWRTGFEAFEPGRVRLGATTLRCRWIVGADGAQSRIRHAAGLPPAWTGQRRLGIRQHFRLSPWSDFVEVHWRRDAQAYVTPVGPEEVCVAILARAPGARLSDLPALFPALASRLRGAAPAGPMRGALSMSTRLAQVTRGCFVMIGDASGSVDAITGEGLSLAFRQAGALGAALAAGDLAAYETSHRRLLRLPLLMARLLLFLGDNDRLRRRAIRLMAARPQLFEHLLAGHVGARRPMALTGDLCQLAFGLLAPGQRLAEGS